MTVSPSTPPVTVVPITTTDSDNTMVTQAEGNLALRQTLDNVNDAFNNINRRIAMLNDKANAICDQC